MKKLQWRGWPNLRAITKCYVSKMIEMWEGKYLNMLSDISDNCQAQQNSRWLTNWATKKFDANDLYELKIDQW